MIIYNVTVKTELSIAEAWLKWMKEEHIPDILATRCFYNAAILEMLEPEEEDAMTFAVQYQANTREEYDEYIKRYADAMRQKAFDKWGNRFIAFRSLLKVVH